MIESDYSGFTITVLAAEIEEEVLRVKNLEAAISDLPGARDRLAALKAEMTKRVSPEQPKDTLDEDSTETMVEAEADEGDGGSTAIEPMVNVDPPEIEKLEAILDSNPYVNNPVVDHEDNELTGERTYIYLDGTRSGAAPASYSKTE